MSGSSEASPLDGIRDVFEAYKLLKSTTLDLKLDLGFVVEHLYTVFDGETPTSWMMSRDSEALEKIRDVFKAYNILSEWNAEQASKILIERLEQVLGQAVRSKTRQHPARDNIVDLDDDDIEIIFIKEEGPELVQSMTMDQEPIPTSSSGSLNSDTAAPQNQATSTSNMETDDEPTIIASVGNDAYRTHKQNLVALTSDVETDAGGHGARNNAPPLTPAPVNSSNQTDVCRHDLDNRTDAAASTNKTPVCNNTSISPEEMILLAREMIRDVVGDTLEKSGSPYTLTSRGTNFVCHLCQKNHRSPELLAAHIWYHHLEERPFFICPYPNCDKTYMTSCNYNTKKLNFLSHVKTRHSGSRKSESRQMTLTAMKLREDILESESLQRSAAPIAETSIDTSTNNCIETGLGRKEGCIQKTQCETPLDKSNGTSKIGGARKRGRPRKIAYNCSHCDKICPSQAALKSHIAYCRSPKLFVCEYCQKSCSTKKVLVTHERVHTVEKSYKCSYCKKQFPTSSSQRVHEISHTGEKPYKCGYCRKVFGTFDGRKYHQDKVHA